MITPELIYMLANVSSLVNTKWYLGASEHAFSTAISCSNSMGMLKQLLYTGIPMNDTTNLRLQIVEVGESILGSNLLGLQLGNEPDLYAGYATFLIARTGS